MHRIDELADLWVAIPNTLKLHGIETFEDLFKLERPPHRRLRNFGRCRLYRLARSMFNAGIEFPDHWKNDDDIKRIIRNRGQRPSVFPPADDRLDALEARVATLESKCLK